MRIAFSMNQSWAEVDDDTQANTRDALRILDNAGATIEEIDLNLVWMARTANGIGQCPVEWWIWRRFEAVERIQRSTHHLRPLLRRNRSERTRNR